MSRCRGEQPRGTRGANHERRNGLFDLPGIVNMYDHGMATLRRSDAQRDDPLFPTKSPLLRPLGLSKDEKRQLLAFLDSLTERRRRVRAPELPAGAAAR